MADNKEKPSEGFLAGPKLRLGEKKWIGGESDGWPEGEEQIEDRKPPEIPRLKPPSFLMPRYDDGS